MNRIADDAVRRYEGLPFSDLSRFADGDAHANVVRVGGYVSTVDTDERVATAMRRLSRLVW